MTIGVAKCRRQCICEYFVLSCIPLHKFASNCTRVHTHSSSPVSYHIYVYVRTKGFIPDSKHYNCNTLHPSCIRLVPFDYTDPGELVLQFGATNNSYSILILIVADGILENNETFLVELTSDTPEVTLNPFSSEVVIVDDSNGMFPTSVGKIRKQKLCRKSTFIPIIFPHQTLQ